MKNQEKNYDKCDRIYQIRQYFCDGNNKLFSEKIGKDASYTSQICNGTKEVGNGMLENLLDTFPQVSRSWLYFGEGEMLNTPSQNTIHTEHQQGDNIQGNNIHYSSDESIMRELLNERTARINDLTETIHELRDSIKHLRTQLEYLQNDYLTLAKKNLEKVSQNNEMLSENRQGLRHIGFAMAALSEGVIQSTTIPTNVRNDVKEAINELADESDFVPSSLNEPIDIERLKKI